MTGLGMSIDYTITIGNIIEIAAIIGGGLLVLVTLKSDVTALKTGAENLRKDLEGIQAEIKKFGEVLISLADMRGEIKVLNTRLTAVEQEQRDRRNHMEAP